MLSKSYLSRAQCSANCMTPMPHPPSNHAERIARFSSLILTILLMSIFIVNLGVSNWATILIAFWATYKGLVEYALFEIRDQ